MLLITWPYYIISLFPKWQTAATINITVHTDLIQTSGRLCPVLAPEGTLMNSSVRSGGAAGILASISVRKPLQTQEPRTGNQQPEEDSNQRRSPFKSKILLEKAKKMAGSEEQLRKLEGKKV